MTQGLNPPLTVRERMIESVVDRLSEGDFPHMVYVAKDYTIADVIRDLKEALPA